MSQSPTRSHTSVRRPASWTAAAAALAATAALAGCGAPGSDTAAAPAEQTREISTDLGEEPITLSVFDGAGLAALDEQIIAAFEEQHPNISVDLRTEPDEVMSTTLPRVLAAQDAACVHRVGTVEAHVEDGLLLNLDPYAEAYGWQEIPDSQLAQYRVNDQGVRGDGSLYAVPSGFVLTGVYYNEDLVTRSGIPAPPQTLEELEAALARAKAAGITPILVNGQDGGLTFIWQSLANHLMGADAVNDWVFRTPEATISSPEGQQAAEIIKRWVDAGYINDDANALGTQDAYGRFINGDALFFFSGNWAAATLEEGLQDRVGFILAPPTEAGGTYAAMSNAASPFGIPASCETPDAAAAFLDFLRSDGARQAAVDNGFLPLGPADAAAPQAPKGAVFTQVQEAFGQVSEDDGIVDFVQNATPGIQADAWVPEGQRLLAGQVTPQEYVANVQGAYTEDLGR